MKSYHLQIFGHVQGVGFRASLAHEAAHLGINGWVRNRRDGSVEALIFGEEAALDRLILWAKKGPAMARVDQLLQTLSSETPEAGFIQKSTI